MFPTPRSRDYKDSVKTVPPSRVRNPGQATLGQYIAINQTEEETNPDGGTLNPMWVEWLMGFPLGWTDLKPLEMHKFQQWQNSHGRF